MYVHFLISIYINTANIYVSIDIEIIYISLNMYNFIYIFMLF